MCIVILEQITNATHNFERLKKNHLLLKFPAAFDFEGLVRKKNGFVDMCMYPDQIPLNLT